MFGQGIIHLAFHLNIFALFTTSAPGPATILYSLVTGAICSLCFISYPVTGYNQFQMPPYRKTPRVVIMDIIILGPRFGIMMNVVNGKNPSDPNSSLDNACDVSIVGRNVA